MDAIVEAINAVDAWVWGPPMIILLLGSHLYLTIRTKFIQRKLPLAIKLSVTPDPDAEGDISQFGALHPRFAPVRGATLLRFAPDSPRTGPSVWAMPPRAPA